MINQWQLDLQDYEKYLPDILGDRGVVLYIHKSLTAFNVDILSDSDFSGSVWCEISLRGTDKLLVGCIYRSPFSSKDNNKKLNDLISKARDLKYSRYLIMGDFNYPEIDWLKNEAMGNRQSDALKNFDCVLENFLFQHICSPTRIRTGQTSNILDLAFTNEKSMIIKDSIKTDSPLGKSDHCMIHFEFCCYVY